MIYFDPGAFDGKYLIGENPLMPVMQFGIFSSWPYYVFLMIISFAALIGKEHFFIYLSVCVLFFQRPYFSTIGYSFYFVIFFLYGIYEINRAFANWKLSYYFSKITAETSGNSKSPPCYPCFRGALAVISYVFYSFQRFTI
jgi:hypothetical protein